MSLSSNVAVRGSRWSTWLSLLFCLALALAPSLAEARAGSSFSGGGGMRSSPPSSMGSRGLRTYENNGAAPITRSMTPQTNPSVGSPGMSPGMAPALGGGSFFSRHPFLTGLAGGFLGSALFSGMGGFGHVFGGLLQFVLIGLVIWFVFRLFAGRGFSFAGGGGGTGTGNMMPSSLGSAAAPAANRFRGQDTPVGDADLTAFQGLHAAVQEAWGHADLSRMRQLMTPEMLSYFSEELTKNASQGVQNVVSDVRLLKGEITESWVEGDLQYATAFLRWSAIDHIVRLGTAPGQPDAVISGDPRTPAEQEEMWTFVRRRGANWLLSAIQQV